MLPAQPRPRGRPPKANPNGKKHNINDARVRINKKEVVQKILIDRGNIDNIRRTATVKHTDQIKNFNKLNCKSYFL